MAAVPHGVRLSLGGAEPLDPVRVTHLAACAAALDAPLVSEHVAFVRAGGREAGHLLPLPRSRASLDVLTAHVRQVQAELDVPLALEPIAALFDWPDDQYTEGEFLTALLERTGAMLLLDVANVYANALNRGTDPEALFDSIARRDRHRCRPPPGPRGMTREWGGAARRVAHSGAASCADAHGDSPGPARAADPAAGLAARQAELVAALVAGGPVPSGFDPGRLAVARRALLRKRAGEAAALWPLLAASLGSAWPEVFTASVSGRAPAGALRDGWDLARELHRRGELGDAAAVELAEREVALHRDGRRRRLPACRRCASGVVVQLGWRVYHVGVR